MVEISAIPFLTLECTIPLAWVIPRRTKDNNKQRLCECKVLNIPTLTFRNHRSVRGCPATPLPLTGMADSPAFLIDLPKF